MPTDVTIKRITYTIEKLDNGNIRVTHAGGQLPMQGPDTEGEYMFEVHPCQTAWYAHWNEHLPPDQRKPTGEGLLGAKPWWSSKSWKKKTRVE
jgi:hypothetical protein